MFFSFETPINKWGELDWWYGPYLEVKFHGDMKQSPCQPAKDPIARRWDLWFWNEVSVFMETSVQRIDQAECVQTCNPKWKTSYFSLWGRLHEWGWSVAMGFPWWAALTAGCESMNGCFDQKRMLLGYFMFALVSPTSFVAEVKRWKKIKTWQRWETAYLRYIDQMNKPENSIFFWLIMCKPCACTRRYITWSHIAKRTVPWPLQTMA